MPKADDEPIMDAALRRKADAAVFERRDRSQEVPMSPQMLIIREMYMELSVPAGKRVATALYKRSRAGGLEGLNAQVAIGLLGIAR